MGRGEHGNSSGKRSGEGLEKETFIPRLYIESLRVLEIRHRSGVILGGEKKTPKGLLDEVYARVLETCKGVARIVEISSTRGETSNDQAVRGEFRDFVNERKTAFLNQNPPKSAKRAPKEKCEAGQRTSYSLCWKGIHFVREEKRVIEKSSPGNTKVHQIRSMTRPLEDGAGINKEKT